MTRSTSEKFRGKIAAALKAKGLLSDERCLELLGDGTWKHEVVLWTDRFPFLSDADRQDLVWTTLYHAFSIQEMRMVDSLVTEAVCFCGQNPHDTWCPVEQETAIKDRIKNFRESFGLGFEDFSLLFGVTKEDVVAWEHGIHPPEMSLRVIISVLNRSPETLRAELRDCLRDPVLFEELLVRRLKISPV